MAVKAAKKKDLAAVALGRKGGRKGGPARAAKLTAKQRSESARKAVQARWKKASEAKDYVVGKRTKMETAPTTMSTIDTSDNAVLALLKRIKATNSQNEIRQLSDRLERVIFHRQHANA